ncbi:hypothetical protein KXX16_001277 [Aspergillus fumigatus]|uniref:Uncharacterized protein n=2 Tax=Aspergillus fumigatus TaxID=746128 RepID=Q4WRP9_ASPFU|nr:hypothetical protein AFUA_1G15540 [Aspergillus fumigatus Af293]EDP56788.1 hypothetical protein AFUB_015080 [Aspergillus fumigatus A1163]KAF4255279.1 hypothetical protein CNMCM8057_004750 [Aspergillus fumigatus]EAL90883.1 hypothetical protein AFUA_1G15540 [Aspergillus fumigatus Af293]KAF4277908.1 hypothetical protein CNMCM8689_004152 [Aspergillus fumigatus]KAF4289849.1 hypothetical protein CNMCM8686_001942 [Aspergillus fumigatus]
MPLQILDGEPPSPPAWGTLPLDIYLLSEWDTPNSSYLAKASQHPVPESPSDRRSRLIRQFLALGSPYQSQTETPPTPTNSQITEILRPARPESLRPYAEYTGSLDEGLYLRLCYDADKEEVHRFLWSQNLDVAFVGPDGIIFDDKELFGGGGINLARFLETFPERVTNAGSVAHAKHRETVLRDTLMRIREGGGNTEAEEEDGFPEEVKDPLLQYGEYHAACVVTHLFIEDEEALDGNGLLHVFFDDTGNVVRHWRTDDEGGDYDFDGTWKEGNWKEDFVSGRGELGVVYREGGVRGPPYEL